MPDVIGWFAEQVRKHYDDAIDVHVEPARGGVHRVTVTAPGDPWAPGELVTRFRARADGNDGMIVTTVLIVGPVARVAELLGTTVIDADAMRQLGAHQLRETFAGEPVAYDGLDTVCLFDPNLGHGWILQTLNRPTPAAPK